MGDQESLVGCGNDMCWPRGRLARALAAVALMSGIVLAAPGAHAERLKDALAAAYANNPQLRAERARLRAIDEEVARAKSGFRPTVTGEASRSFKRSNTENRPSVSSFFGRRFDSTSDGPSHPGSFSATLRQSVFSGFRTLNAMREAEANVRAGREDLRRIEQSVLLEAITAYMDVVRDRAIVRLRRNNVKVLSRDLKATRDRFAVGEVTKTDVAQARARRARAVSALDLAKSNLRTSRGVFERIVGHSPDGLAEAFPMERLLPRSLEEALRIGQSENPSVLAAVFREEAARYAIDRIKGELLPEVSVEARYDRQYNPSRTTSDTETTTVTGRVTVPFYQGGEVSARVRQAKQTQLQRLAEIEQARVQVRSDVVAAWSRLQAARAQLRSDRVQVEANRTALAGVREEEKVGQRTLLEVLNAEQELLDSKVSLVSTERDLVVASYSLLAAIGRLTVADLGVPAALYDAEAHLREVKHKWWGFTVKREDGYRGYEGVTDR